MPDDPKIPATQTGAPVDASEAKDVRDEKPIPMQGADGSEGRPRTGPGIGDEGEVR